MIIQFPTPKKPVSRVLQCSADQARSLFEAHGAWDNVTIQYIVYRPKSFAYTADAPDQQADWFDWGVVVSADPQHVAASIPGWEVYWSVFEPDVVDVSHGFETL